jgi:uncharacterized protein YkwD
MITLAIFSGRTVMFGVSFRSWIMGKVRDCILAGFIIASLSGCIGASETTGSTQYRQAANSASSASVNPSAALASVNAYRAANGLGPVRLDPQLMQAASSHSRSMQSAGQMSHDVGGSFSSRMSAHGVGRAAAVENIAAGQRSLSEVMTAWQNSWGHAANLKNSGMTRMGIAVSGGYWTLIMAGDANRYF